MNNKNYPHITKDSKGNTIHYKNGKFESWSEFNDKGEVTHYKDTTGFESWFEHKGNKIHCKDNTGFTSYSEHDDTGLVIYYQDSTGSEFWYDDKGGYVPYRAKEVTMQEIADMFKVPVASLKIVEKN